MNARVLYLRWICILSLVAVSAMLMGQSAAPLAPAQGPPFDGQPVSAPDNPIDTLVFARLAKLGIAPANSCSDEAFVRRVYLDVIGTLPTEAEVKEFLADRRAGKRGVLIDKLLERDEFADYWAMKWSDLLRVKAEFPINLWPNAAEVYHRWIRTSIKDNKPYDRCARELLTASGSNFREPAVNFYRAVQSRDPKGLAQAAALTFMGSHAEKWPAEQWDGMAGFFALVSYKSTKEWKEEIVIFDIGKAAAAGPMPRAVFPDGTRATLSADRDPRLDFADWLITPQNPWFGRNIVNRAWAWLMGRGIIQEADDVRPDNPPVNPELLAYLEKELVAGKYDLKHIYRLILNSQTYQLSCVAKSREPAAAANFASYPLRRLDAEVLIDAICQITGTTEQYSSAVPEPFTFVPVEHRTIALSDGSITSSFLTSFGRPPRDTGWESERINRTTAGQELELLNSSHIQKKIEQGPKLQAILQAGKPIRDTAIDLYLTILSRNPTDEELRVVAAYAQPTVHRRREALLDLAWALMNSPEFLYRH
jgi:hypothetical protein